MKYTYQLRSGCRNFLYFLLFDFCKLWFFCDIHFYLSEYHSYGVTDKQSGYHAEDMAAAMLASTLGIEFDEDKSRFTPVSELGIGILSCFIMGLFIDVILKSNIIHFFFKSSSI